MTPESFRNECISSTDADVTFSIGENETIGTGTKVTVSYENGLDVEYEFLIYGDVDGDGYCDGRDAIIVNCLVNGMLSDEQMDYVNWIAADCSRDGEINESAVELLCSAGVFNSEIAQSNIV